MIDDIDKKIIDLLQSSGREPATSLADKVGLSVPSVIERMKKLQDANIILGYSADINYKAMGVDISAIITIMSESSAHYTEFRKKTKESDEIKSCFSTTGNGSHILFVRTKNTDSLEGLLSEIQGWPGVIRTETQLILSSFKD